MIKTIMMVEEIGEGLKMTKEFIGNKEGKLTGLKTVEVEWITNTEGEKEQIFFSFNLKI